MLPYYGAGAPLMKIIFHRWQARKALPTEEIPLSRAEGVAFGDRKNLSINTTEVSPKDGVGTMILHRNLIAANQPSGSIKTRKRQAVLQEPLS